MGLGNLFDGATEDVLLYVVAPGVGVGSLAAFAALQWLVSRRLAASAESWRDPHASRPEVATVDYRAPATTHAAAGAPRTVRWLARLGVSWSLATFLVYGVAAVIVYGGLGACGALLSVLVPWVTALVVARCALGMTDRHGEAVGRHLERARTALLVHHALLLLEGTALVVLLFGSDAYFWNAPGEPGAERLVWLGVGYALVVLVPCAVGVALTWWLRSVRGLYASVAAR